MRALPFDCALTATGANGIRGFVDNDGIREPVLSVEPRRVVIGAGIPLLDDDDDGRVNFVEEEAAAAAVGDGAGDELADDGADVLPIRNDGIFDLMVSNDGILPTDVLPEECRRCLMLLPLTSFSSFVADEGRALPSDNRPVPIDRGGRKPLCFILNKSGYLLRLDLNCFCQRLEPTNGKVDATFDFSSISL
jgi:hypothetical protein